jgi:hypothetical protein
MWRSPTTNVYAAAAMRRFRRSKLKRLQDEGFLRSMSQMGVTLPVTASPGVGKEAGRRTFRKDGQNPARKRQAGRRKKKKEKEKKIEPPGRDRQKSNQLRGFGKAIKRVTIDGSPPAQYEYNGIKRRSEN